MANTLALSLGIAALLVGGVVYGNAGRAKEPEPLPDPPTESQAPLELETSTAASAPLVSAMKRVRLDGASEELPLPILNFTRTTTPKEAETRLGKPLSAGDEMGMGFQQVHQIGAQGIGPTIVLSWSATGYLETVLLRFPNADPAGVAAMRAVGLDDPVLSLIGIDRPVLLSRIGIAANCPGCPHIHYLNEDPFGVLDIGFDNEKCVELSWSSRASYDEFMRTGFSSLDEPYVPPAYGAPIMLNGQVALMGQVPGQPLNEAAPGLGKPLTKQLSEFSGTASFAPAGVGESMSVRLYVPDFAAYIEKKVDSPGALQIGEVTLRFEFVAASDRPAVLALFGPPEPGTLAEVVTSDYRTLRSRWPEAHEPDPGTLEVAYQAADGAEGVLNLLFDTSVEPARLVRVELQRALPAASSDPYSEVP